MSGHKHKPFKVGNELWIVPCITLSNQNVYEPLFRPAKDEVIVGKLQTRQAWSEMEDLVLVELVSEHGPKAWNFISDQLNDRVHETFPVRKAKQCRERWTSNLDPEINKEPWSLQEDLMLKEKHEEIGNKWSEIAKFLKNRTENQVKNRFNHLKRKTLSEKVKNEGFF
jgi:hypothetical protein